MFGLVYTNAGAFAHSVQFLGAGVRAVKLKFGAIGPRKPERKDLSPFPSRLWCGSFVV